MKRYFDDKTSKNQQFFINSMHYNIKLNNRAEKIHFVQTVQKGMTQNFTFSNTRKIGLFVDKPQLLKALTVSGNMMLAAGTDRLDKIENQYGQILERIGFDQIKDVYPSSLSERQSVLVELAIHFIREANVLLIDLDVPRNQLLVKDPEIASLLSFYFKEAVKMTYHEGETALNDLSNTIDLVYGKGGIQYEK